MDKGDRYLGVLDSPGGAGVLALNADSMDALLHIPGLVDHQHDLLVVEMAHDVVADIVAYRVGVPDSPAQQVLHPVWGLLPGPLGDRPAVLADQPTIARENTSTTNATWTIPDQVAT